MLDKNSDFHPVEPKRRESNYVVPMSKEQKKDWSNAVNKANDISTGKVTPPYLKK